MTPSHWTHWLYIALGGASGALARALFYYIAYRLDYVMPWATLTVNILGSLLVGFLLGYEWFYHGLNASARWLMVVGFCGSFTTFSALSWEALNWIRLNQWLNACTYTFGSLTMGILSAAIGFKLALWSLEAYRAYT